MQTKKESLVEAAFNTASGMAIAIVVTNLVVYFSPITLFGYTLLSVQVSPVDSITWTVLMTLISVSRSYTWRRYFNDKHKEDI